MTKKHGTVRRALCCLALVAALTACVPRDSNEAVGRVVEGGTGRALAGAKVTLVCLRPAGLESYYVAETLETLSGPDGIYEFKSWDILGCHVIEVRGSKEGYVTGGMDSLYGDDDHYHIVLTPPAELSMQTIIGLANEARGTRSPNDGFLYAVVFSSFFRAMRIAKTEREIALVRESFCPLLIERWTALSDEGRSYARAQQFQTAQGVAAVNHEGVVVPYCARRE